MIVREYLLGEGRRGKLKIAITEPRRVACSSLAKYVAEKQGLTLGSEVGYAFRFHNESNEET